MSDYTEAGSLDFEEMHAGIRRAQAETDKFAEETRKFVAEERKLLAEERKLSEEGLKIRRDRLVQPVIAVAGLAGGIGGIAVALLQLALRSGAHP